MSMTAEEVEVGVDSVATYDSDRADSNAVLSVGVVELPASRDLEGVS